MIPVALTTNSLGRTKQRRLAKISISLASICKPAGMTVAITLGLVLHMSYCKLLTHLSPKQFCIHTIIVDITELSVS